MKPLRSKKVLSITLVVISLIILLVVVSPLFLNSRIERIFENNLPSISIEDGSTVYCRMKADDFRFPLPPGASADPMKVKPQAITPRRSSLIKKGMIYSPEHGYLDFTVPLFAQFMKRFFDAV